MSESILSLVAAFGLGSVVTALVSSWLSSRQQANLRGFEEKKAAYVGLLEAYHKAAVEPSDANAKNFAYWQLRCELVASSRVVSAIEDIVQSNDDAKARSIAHENMKASMRADLGVAK